jgi:hypothetical protein
VVVATWMATAAAQAPTWGLGAGLGPWLAADTRPGASPDFDLATAVRAGVAVRPPLWLATEWALALSEGGVRWAPRAQVEILNPGATFRPGLTAGDLGAGRVVDRPGGGGADAGGAALGPVGRRRRCSAPGCGSTRGTRSTPRTPDTPPTTW